MEQIDRMEPLTREDIRRATSRDQILSRVAQYLHSGWSERGPAELQPFEAKKSELSLSCGLWLYTMGKQSGRAWTLPQRGAEGASRQPSGDKQDEDAGT